MATTAQILSAEEAKPTKAILLFREGLFWKANNRSTFRFNAVTGANYKLTKKFVKAVGCEVVSGGVEAIVARIMNFRIENSSPMECMNFVNEGLKSKLAIQYWDHVHQKWISL